MKKGVCFSYGRQVMGTSLYLREHHFPNAYAKIAA
jgi:hypothetical protein